MGVGGTECAAGEQPTREMRPSPPCRARRAGGGSGHAPRARDSAAASPGGARGTQLPDAWAVPRGLGGGRPVAPAGSAEGLVGRDVPQRPLAKPPTQPRAGPARAPPVRPRTVCARPGERQAALLSDVSDTLLPLHSVKPAHFRRDLCPFYSSAFLSRSICLSNCLFQCQKTWSCSRIP